MVSQHVQTWYKHARTQARTRTTQRSSVAVQEPRSCKPIHVGSLLVGRQMRARVKRPSIVRPTSTTDGLTGGGRVLPGHDSSMTTGRHTPCVYCLVDRRLHRGSTVYARAARPIALHSRTLGITQIVFADPRVLDFLLLNVLLIINFFLCNIFSHWL